MVQDNPAIELRYRLEEFYYLEAALLDEYRFREWLQLFTPDARYWMPVRENLAESVGGLHPEDALQVSLIDDDYDFMVKRVERLETGLAHAEMPASRTTHLVSNIRVTGGDAERLTTESKFIVVQNRLDVMEHTFSGRRHDTIVCDGSAFRIAKRKVVLDRTVLPRTLSTFF